MIFRTAILFYFLFINAGCSESKMNCNYQVLGKYEFIVTNEVKDAGFNDYLCRRNIIIIEKSTNIELNIQLPESERCSFFIKEIFKNNETYLAFYNEDNLGYKIINMNTGKEMLQEYNKIKLSDFGCNCNTLKCNVDENCHRIEVCSYDF